MAHEPAAAGTRSYGKSFHTFDHPFTYIRPLKHFRAHTLAFLIFYIIPFAYFYHVCALVRVQTHHISLKVFIEWRIERSLVKYA